MTEYRCIERCFFRNTLFTEGAVVFAQDSEMADHRCFEPVNPVLSEKKAKTVKKTAKTDK